MLSGSRLPDAQLRVLAAAPVDRQDRPLIRAMIKVALRKELLESCNLHTVLDCPGGTFQGAGVKTVVLFFEKGAKTRSVWYYQLDPGRSLGKTNPLNDADLAEFVALQPPRTDGAQSWSVDVASLDPATWDLSVKNPNAPEAAPLRSPEEIIDAMLARDAETAGILLTLATGTGKTSIAFQIAWKLYHASWNLSRDRVRRPRILFLPASCIAANTSCPRRRPGASAWRTWSGCIWEG